MVGEQDGTGVTVTHMGIGLIATIGVERAIDQEIIMIGWQLIT